MQPRSAERWKRYVAGCNGLISPDTSKGRLYSVSRGEHDKREKHRRPQYSLEFKQDATKRVLEEGYSQQQAADHLGISLSALGRWVRVKSKPSTNGSAMKKPNLSLENYDELIRLRKENVQLRMERELLNEAISPNRLDRQFQVAKLNQVRTTDMTYVRTRKVGCMSRW